MAVRVLVVDDSRFFRRRVTEMLESDGRIKVIGSAENGNEAIQMAGRLKPDVITMDIEMPVMDGITSTKRILANQRVPILMFSSLTTEGAKATLDALDAGAVDFLPKRFEDISKDKDEAKKALCERVVSVSQQFRSVPAPSIQRAPPPAAKAPVSAPPPRSSFTSPAAKPGTPSAGIVRGQYKLLAIGTSTGGPVALQQVLTKLPANFALPIVLVQHMPGTFTGAFAERLNGACAIKVAEAKDGDVLQAGTALLAPGGKQMTVERAAGKHVVRIHEAKPEHNYKPCVDITFNSIAECGIGKTLAVVLTGMGADGCIGAQALKKKGASVWAQNQATCVVYGMPAAIVEAGIADQVLSLDDIGTNLAQRI